MAALFGPPVDPALVASVVATLRDAVEEASAHERHFDADQWCERALALLAADASSLVRAELLVWAAESLRAEGHLNAGRAAAVAAVRLDPEPALLARAALAHVDPGADMGLACAEFDPATTALLERALRLIGDEDTAMSAVLVHVGDRLGLYRALGDSRAVTTAELASRTGLAERYVREWCNNQAAAGWLRHDAAAGTFQLPPALAILVADESAPSFLLGGFDFIASAWADEELVVEAFRTGAGIGWHQHDCRLFAGTERFFRPGYQANLITEWIPALDRVGERLAQGGRIADVGCGHGAATVLLEQAFPACTVSGFDYHDESIERARRLADDAGVSDRVRFTVAAADEVSGEYDLVCLFDCLHDMGDPVGVAWHLRDAIAPDGTLLLVEPAAGDRPEENHHRLGRLMYAASTMICTPASLAQPGALGLGNQVGPDSSGELGSLRAHSARRLPSSGSGLCDSLPQPSWGSAMVDQDGTLPTSERRTKTWPRPSY